MPKPEEAWNPRQLALFFGSLVAGMIGGGLAGSFGVPWALGAPSLVRSTEHLLDSFNLGAVLGTLFGMGVGLIGAKRDRPNRGRQAMIATPILAAVSGFLGVVLIFGALVGLLLRAEGS